MTLQQVLQPAIDLAENGFVLGPITADGWKHGFLQGDEALNTFRPNGNPPRAGDLVYNKNLAKTFRSVAEKGTQVGFY